jgi:hypothetical protein
LSSGGETSRKPLSSFATGTAVGILGGLIGLGGAEFRLPLLMAVFGYATLPAIVVNLLVSLVTVFFSFIFRLKVIGIGVVASNLSAQARYAAGVREVLECWFEGRPSREKYLIVDGGKLAGAGAHSYSAGNATGGADEAVRFKISKPGSDWK